MPLSTEGSPDAVGPAILEIRLGDRLELRHAHACGGMTWHVVRLGADIGLTCDTCARRILLARRDLEHRFRRWVDRAPR